MNEREDTLEVALDQPADQEPTVLDKTDPKPHPTYRNHEPYTPSDEVKELLTFNPNLLDEIRLGAPEVDGLKLVERYCQSVSYHIGKVEPDKIKARATGDGNNVVYAMIMRFYFEDEDATKFVNSGKDLNIVSGILKNNIEKQYDNLVAYKLWAGLYLDLREAIFEAEKNEENIQAIGELREIIASE